MFFCVAFVLGCSGNACQPLLDQLCHLIHLSMIYMIHLLVIRTTFILKVSTIFPPSFIYPECTNITSKERYTLLLQAPVPDSFSWLEHIPRIDASSYLILYYVGMSIHLNFLLPVHILTVIAQWYATGESSPAIFSPCYQVTNHKLGVVMCVTVWKDFWFSST